jgi:integrase
MRKATILRIPARRKKGLAKKTPKEITIRQRKRHPNRPLTEAQIRVFLSCLDDIRDDALIRLGLSVGMRVSEVVTIRTSEIDFEQGLIKIWDEKKDKWRLVMSTLETMSAIKKYLNTLRRQPQFLFPMTTKTVERVIQRHSKKALDFVISWCRYPD